MRDTQPIITGLCDWCDNPAQHRKINPSDPDQQVQACRGHHGAFLATLARRRLLAQRASAARWTGVSR